MCVLLIRPWKGWSLEGKLKKGVPVFVGRYDDFDLRIERPIFSHDGKSLQLIGQAFNLFGTTNLLNANMTTNALSTSFGKITAANNVQEGEVAVKFTFWFQKKYQIYYYFSFLKPFFHVHFRNS